MGSNQPKFALNYKKQALIFYEQYSPFLDKDRQQLESDIEQFSKQQVHLLYLRFSLQSRASEIRKHAFEKKISMTIFHKTTL
jgi:hypothetical protein